LKDYLVLGSIVAVVIFLDQLTKDLVRNALPLGGMWSPWPWLEPYARIVHWYNTGVAFGMFQGFGGIFTVIAIIVSAAIIYYYPRVPVEDWPLRLAMGLQMGGALGNMIDRLTQGHVTDFISVGNFAVFNVADSSITIGVAILLLGVYLQERNKTKADALKPDSGTAEGNQAS
jgi:signal peptidase II